jgi:TetR/AcrR family transcriptional repressor of nem operon
MRYQEGHKETTRARILDEASRRFREEGIAAVGVANLMGGIGLTQGGFYNHFESKDDLASQAIVLSNEGTMHKLGEARQLSDIVGWYLSPAHRDNPGRGCPAAALSAEIGRSSAEVRESFTVVLDGVLAIIKGCLPKKLSAARKRSVAMAMFASMVGTLSLARAVSDEKMSKDLLAAGRRAVLAMVPDDV